MERRATAFAGLDDPASRAYYDKKIAQGKHHTHALLQPAAAGRGLTRIGQSSGRSR